MRGEKEKRRHEGKDIYGPGERNLTTWLSMDVYIED